MVIPLWDPAQVKDEPELHDEYDTYLGRLARLLREGGTESDVASYFARLSRT